MSSGGRQAQPEDVRTQ